ncbi:ABC transporter permease [Paraburkholderia caribensis]|uniref:ABC transporter permease n=1 Tax=Paraburkholderia caribensis TaxID=75105 RepID=UPI00072232DC|nr:ABC transporter permease [Paraburkholderia caribensis]ALP62205.1 ABC transporter permease [Paraburkholderia caribensis]AUT52567.1 ABC transporter permease [Paraburkholderia caribensis]
MQSHSATPTGLVISLIRNRRLLIDLAKRDAIGRYKGSVLGIFWSLLTPLLMLSVYTFVFSAVFKSRWQNSGVEASKAEFAVVLFAGMIVFNLFSECVSRAPSLILSNANFVKKIIFPLEILPCVTLLSALFHSSVSLVILLVAEWIVRGSVPWTAILIPFIVAPLCLFILGACWFLAATGVFLRDIGQTIGILITALMFLSPVFFSITSLPPRFQQLVYLNPMTFPIEQGRNLLIWGQMFDWRHWAIYTVSCALFACIGFAWFQKTRRGFADVV